MIDWLLKVLGFRGMDFTGQTKNRLVNMIIIHCSATKPDMDIGYDDIKSWHVNERGWSDIGYHYIIKRDGSIQDGRDRDQDGDIFEEVGAHTYSYNKNSLGICLVGGIDKKGKPEPNFTNRQWRALSTLVRGLKAEFPKSTVHGHNEFAKKACPSFDVQTWLKSVNI